MRLALAALVFAWTAALAAPAGPATDDLAPVKESAVLLYDQGAYGEALSTLQQLDAARALDGALLYRLFFCEKATGHPDEARKALDRAREALESEPAAVRTLETAFYLANTYSNLGRAQDARETARDMTAKVEAGRVPRPTTAIGQFQLGKLYQDQGRQSDAVACYQKAVDGFDLGKGRYAGNVRWALRFIGAATYAQADFAGSETAFARLTAMGGADAPDWDALAAARARLGKYAPAADAWRASVKADPANADDARYSARLADQAAALAPLPAAGASGTAFESMGKADLETFLRSKADEAVAAQTRAGKAMQPDASGAPTAALDPKLRAELAEALKQARKQFVAAGLEYALRRYGIRETAFREGYAVQIFQDRVWDLPADPAPGAGASRSGS